jgi:uncharacterized OB-fold protein
MIETVRINATRSYPPRISKFTQPFWQALTESRWTTTRCVTCEKLTFPPKANCPHCWSTDVRWVALDTRGTVYSRTRIHAAPTVFAHEAPYSVGIVDLDCGIRLACKLLDPEGGEASIGSRVEIVRLQYDDGDFFAARPAAT